MLFNTIRYEIFFMIDHDSRNLIEKNGEELTITLFNLLTFPNFSKEREKSFKNAKRDQISNIHNTYKQLNQIMTEQSSIALYNNILIRPLEAR